MRTAYDIDSGKQVTARVGTCFACGVHLDHESHKLVTQDSRTPERYRVHAEWCVDCNPFITAEWQTVRWAE